MTSDADESSTVSQDELKSKSDSDFVGSDRDGSNNGEDSSPPNDDKADSSPMKLHKLIALLTLFVTAFGVGILTHTILENQETNLFEDRAKAYSEEITGLLHQGTTRIYKAALILSSTITSYAMATNASWPFVTIPHFEMRGSLINDLSNAKHVTLAPLVHEDLRVKWEAYASDNQQWIQDGLSFRNEENSVIVPPIAKSIFDVPQAKVAPFTVKSTGSFDIPTESRVFAPAWQQAPAPNNTTMINMDLLSNPGVHPLVTDMILTGRPILSEAITPDHHRSNGHEIMIPHICLLQPVLERLNGESLTDENSVVAFLAITISMDTFLSNMLNLDNRRMVLVFDNHCGDVFTYQLSDDRKMFVGNGDLHDRAYDHLAFRADLAPTQDGGDSSECHYDLIIYPSRAMENDLNTSKPFLYSFAIVSAFVITIVVFLVYDNIVTRRHLKVVANANRVNRIISSLFPGNVRDRIMQEAEEDVFEDVQQKWKSEATGKSRLKSYLADGFTGEEKEDYITKRSKPIADLFTDVTVMFADIVGFTAWSSVREPSQVFSLLETVYAAFDEIARKRKVFKVETVGDCYVAVAGLPDPRRDHATAMARFARDCMIKMNTLTKQLELELGPDTGDLSIRVGLHSGPVTAGVLRGERSRFQLFGDTMNTTSRIESTGEPGRIHISSDTAELLINDGKSHWVSERMDIVSAKGKGEMRTFWLELKPSAEAAQPVEKAPTAVSVNVVKPSTLSLDDKVERLVNWNVDILLKLLRELAARREAMNSEDPGRYPIGSMEELKQLEASGDSGYTPGMVIDEVQEIVDLQRFSPSVLRRQRNSDNIELGEKVVEQVRSFVRTIASMYKDNPFHNFEHASHVTMSTVKLLSRIASPDYDPSPQKATGGVPEEDMVRDLQFGITADPLTRFACVFASLIHDVDHRGVPNTQLVKENTLMARFYRNRSVAEQNSVNLSWTLLMSEEYKEFRRSIYSTPSGFRRFRSLVVNAVMATDIMDKDLKQLRNGRWDKAFKESSSEEQSPQDGVNRRATIVIEHVIQASDVSHTMQHWHVFLKWNQRLFDEMYRAYQTGRAEKDPSEFWYAGEIGFFDFYIIPLAKKLKTCGVFGVSSDECLNYAINNRREWEARGREIVASYVEKYSAARPM